MSSLEGIASVSQHMALIAAVGHILLHHLHVLQGMVQGPSRVDNQEPTAVPPQTSNLLSSNTRLVQYQAFSQCRGCPGGWGWDWWALHRSPLQLQGDITAKIKLSSSVDCLIR